MRNPGRADTASIEDLLREQARRIPDRIAIVAPGRNPLSYGGLLAQVEDVVRHT